MSPVEKTQLPSIDRTKKLFYPHFHENSEEFKDLGTLHKANRKIEYYPSENINYEKQRILDYSATPQAISKKWKRKQVIILININLTNEFSLREKLDTKYKDEDHDLKQQVIEKAKEKMIMKNYVGTKLHEENQRILALGNQMRSQKASDNAGRSGQIGMFPDTTNKSFLN